MPDSLYDTVKDFIPVAAAAGLGALAGGKGNALTGAMLGAGSAAGAEEKEQDRGQARQEKALQLLSVINQRKEAQAYREQSLADRQQAEKDREADRQAQLSIERVHSDQEKWYQSQSRDARRQHDKEWLQQTKDNRSERDMLAKMSRGGDITDDDYKGLLSTVSPELRDKWGDVKSPEARKMIAQQIIKNHAADNDAMRDKNLQTIAKAYGGDLDKTMETFGDYSGKELTRLAHSVNAKKLTTPAQLDREAKQNASEMKDLATSLKKEGDYYDTKTLAGKIGIGNPDAKAKAIVQRLSAKKWVGMTPDERTAQEKVIARGLRNGMSYSDIADLIAPMDRVEPEAKEPASDIPPPPEGFKVAK